MVGNVIVAKHASNVPQSALAFEDVLRRAGAPDGDFPEIKTVKFPDFLGKSGRGVWARGV